MLTTTSSRHARSFIHRTVEPAQRSNSATVLGDASEEELTLLRCLLNSCLREAEESGRHVGQRVQAFTLVNASPFAAEFDLDRIDRATALVGDQWMNTLTFAHGLANHLRRRIDTEEVDQAMLGIWKQATYLSNAAELMCRVSMTAPSHHGWICGLLVGATEICARLGKLPTTQARKPAMRRRGTFTIELTRLLVALGCEKELSLFDTGSHSHGPWNALSASVELMPPSAALDWVQMALIRIHPLTWPASLSDLLVERIAELETESLHFAEAVWQRAVQ